MIKLKQFFDVKGLFKPRKLAVMAMMLALKVVLSQFSIYLTPTLKLISFDYLPGAMVSIMYGPVAGLVFGLLADTLGYVAKPQGTYFIGYALSEMLANFIYSVFLYKRPITFLRTTFAKITITVLVSFGLNSIWSSILYGQTAGSYINATRVINNIIQLPLYVILIVFFARLMQKIDLSHHNRM